MNKIKPVDRLIKEMRLEQKKRDVDRKAELKRLDKIRNYKKNHGISVLDKLNAGQLHEALHGKKNNNRPVKKKRIRKKTKRVKRAKRKQDTFYDSKEWREVRYKALKLHGRQCLCCGAKPPGVVLHVDHIKPRSKFPNLELDINNLQILCKDCNLGKSNYDDIDYRES